MRGPFRGSGLQEVRASILDCELDVLHVPEMTFERCAVLGDRLEGLWKVTLRGSTPLCRERLRWLSARRGVAHARDDIFALGVGQELAVELLVAARWVCV